jgi:hypothetical protein
MFYKPKRADFIHTYSRCKYMRRNMHMDMAMGSSLRIKHIQWTATLKDVHGIVPGCSCNSSTLGISYVSNTENRKREIFVHMYMLKGLHLFACKLQQTALTGNVQA